MFNINKGFDDEKQPKERITTNSICNNLMTFSYHVESWNEIRCYFFRNQQICRFFTTDVINVLPLLFDEDSFNDYKFVNCNKLQNILEQNEIIDNRFDLFNEQMNGINCQNMNKNEKIWKARFLSKTNVFVMLATTIIGVGLVYYIFYRNKKCADKNNRK